MTGLEKMIKAIEAEALANSEAILNQAKKEAEDIMQAAKIEADKKCAEIAAKSEADAKDVLRRAASAAGLLEKKAILDAKQQMINNIITEARNSLAKLSDTEYARTILQMIQKYAHNKSGSILFAASDKGRFPKEFEAMVQKALADKPGASLTFTEESADLSGGFILKYGDIEENCSFDALFSAAKEELQDKVNSVLFD
jgi:V/A-type H+-transporting ATPase subunit E